MAATKNTRAPARRSTGKPAPAQVVAMVPMKAAAGSVQWVRRKPVERIPHVVAAGVYGSGALAHMTGFGALGIMLGTVSAAGVGYVAINKKTGDESTAGLAAACTMAAGSWIAAASQFGVLWGNVWGPFNFMTTSFLIMYLIGYRKYRTNGRMTRRVEDREDQIWWMQVREAWKLPNSLLIAREQTRLGEKYVINIMGTGRLASHIATRALEEHIAAIHKLDRKRVKAAEGKSADRIVVSIRFTDPWAKPITHPLLDSAPEITLPFPSDVRKNAVIGQDPETGAPLSVEVVDAEEGANRIMIVGTSGGGKTVLVNNLLERLTACPNALVCCIDLAKAKEMRRFRKAGALGPSALGETERKKALRILEFASAAVRYRSRQSVFTDEAVHVPRENAPAIILVIDEVDELFAIKDRVAAKCARELDFLMSKGRSEMVSTILIGQRGTAKWMGGANIRANFNLHIMLKVDRQNEMRLAAGESGLEMPDMSKYGEGHAGVALVAKKGHPWHVGRTFKLRELRDLDRIAEGRTPGEIEQGLAAELGDKWTKLVNGSYDAAAAAAPAMAGSGGGHAPLPAEDAEALSNWFGDGEDEEDEEAMGVDAAGGAGLDDDLAELDRSIEEALPNDLRDRMEKMMNRTQQNLDQAHRNMADRIEFPPPTPEEKEKLAASAEARWRQYADQTEISPGHMKTIMELVERPEGASSGELADATKIARTSMWRVLNKLKVDGLAHPEPPRGRNARWYRGPAPDAGGDVPRPG